MAKGSDWEREVSKKLSLWWTDGKRDDVIWRTAGSGARHTTRAKQGKKTAGGAGDHAATDPIAEPLFKLLLIESKKGYSSKKVGPSGVIDVLYLLDKLEELKTPPLLLKWWDKAFEECKTAKRKWPVIIFKRANKRACIMMAVDMLSIAEALSGIYPHTILQVLWPYPEDDAPLKQDLAIVDFELFLDWCPPETIKSMVEDME